MISDAAHAENIMSTHGLSRTGGNAVTTENRARSRPTTFPITRKHCSKSIGDRGARAALAKARSHISYPAQDYRTDLVPATSLFSNNYQEGAAFGEGATTNVEGVKESREEQQT